MAAEKTEDQGAAAAPIATASTMPLFPWWTSMVVFLGAFALRLYNVGETYYWLDDSVIHAPTAYPYTRLGLLGPDSWWTQPLKHVLLYASALLFGDDPVGWRMRNVLFGAGVVLLTFLLARAILRSRFAAVAAASLMALDPLSIAFSRTTQEDIPATFFILAACLLFVRAVRSDSTRDWVSSGLLMGVALALRWYAVIPLAIMVVLAVARHREGGAPSISRVLAYLVPLPLTVYVAAFLPWAARGYSVGDWLLLNADSYRVQAAGMPGVFDVDLSRLAGPARWFTAWVGASMESYAPGGYSAVFNDPPVWLLLVPAAGYLLWRGYRSRSLPALLVGGSFVSLYVFFLTAGRPIMLYSALPVLPFGFVALGFAADRLLGRRAWYLLAAAVAWSVFLYPLASGVPVPPGAYGWLLQRFGVV
jgi:dolichyl-phosphate-mannose-protein mannosyltransferase